MLGIHLIIGVAENVPPSFRNLKKQKQNLARSNTKKITKLKKIFDSYGKSLIFNPKSRFIPVFVIMIITREYPFNLER